MKRTPLRRLTPLTSRSQLKATPLKRSEEPMAKVGRRGRETAAAMNRSRPAVMHRSNGVCEVCQAANAQHMHHIERRSHGDHSPANLLHVCFTCHEWIHSHPAEAKRSGYLK